MTEPLWIWGLTILVIIGLLAFDFFFHVRKAHEPTIREAAIWSGIYVALALVFGLTVLLFGGPQMGSEYFAGYITEKALSVDNLFVFLVIMGSFAVPRIDQQKVLLFGIVFALIARTAFIFAGKALIENFSFMFYLFGLILLLTAGKLLAPEKEGDDEANNFIIRLAKKYLRTTDHYDGDKLFTYENGRRVLTPMLLVMVAIGGTDVLFALDSIPAIYGLTTDVYIVFTATAFSLMGLRQLYFLIEGLLDRLIYLKYGLALVLAFIGVKLILEALHKNELPFINGGENVDVFTFTAATSLPVIIGLLVITVLISLYSKRGRVTSVVGSLDRLAHAYLHTEYKRDAAERDEQWAKIQAGEQRLSGFDHDLIKRVLSDTGADWALERAHKLHDESKNA
ncbi:TerC family protein [Tessaracoccus antarcticus]|uniref:TerC family protein n=1 Tax=Tessaracoccus antarcticus TaxID=2479848 RepID=A0A3M0GIX8_9ACTN|nr:TerC family protein [Tessaracoccus antarcticus]RMB61573.1 TerC family protein [Tessaracoccus antarcticus]